MAAIQEFVDKGQYAGAAAGAFSAASSFEKAYELDPKNLDVKWDLATSWHKYALYSMRAGKLEKAKSANQRAFTLFNELYNELKTNDMLYNLSVQAEQSGDNLVDLQDTENAHAMYTVALQTRQTLRMNNDIPPNREAVDRISSKLNRVSARSGSINLEELHDFFDFNYEEGDREFESGRFREAAESYANSVKAGLAIVEYQGGLQNMRNTAMACKKAGDTLLKLRRFGEAVDYFGQMEELAHRTLAGGGDHTDLYLANLAQAWAGSAYAAWGRVQDARKKYNDALQSAQALASINPSQFQNMPNDYIAILNSL